MLQAGRLSLIIDLDVLVAMPWAAGAQPAVDEAVEIAVEDALRVAGADTGAQVLHHLIGLQHVAADLAAEADFPLLAVELLHLAALLVEPALVKPGLQDVHRGGLVLDLRTFVLADHNETGGKVRNANRGVRRVDTLTAFA